MTTIEPPLSARLIVMSLLLLRLSMAVLCLVHGSGIMGGPLFWAKFVMFSSFCWNASSSAWLATGAIHSVGV